MNVNLAPIEVLKTLNVQIGIITENNQISVDTLNSILQWSNTASMIGISWDLITVDSEQNYPLVRNYLSSKFIDNPKATHLLFIGNNIGFEPHYILQMLSSEKHILGGMVPMEPGNPPPVNIDRTDDMLVEDAFLEVNSLDFNFLMMDKEAFKYLGNHKLSVPYKDAQGELRSTYFNQEIINGLYKTDDLALCSKWQDLGGKLWLHGEVKVSKSGIHTFSA